MGVGSVAEEEHEEEEEEDDGEREVERSVFVGSQQGKHLVDLFDLLRPTVFYLVDQLDIGLVDMLDGLKLV